MTPAARYAAAITVLDQVLAGSATEKALLAWARNSRFAGSKDRAAVRDIVFDGVRKRRSAAWRGGAESGRGIVLGLLREAGVAPETVFTGEGHAPSPMQPEEQHAPAIADAPEAVQNDHADWLTPHLKRSLGDDYAAVMQLQRERAEVFLRVNHRRTTRAEAVSLLSEDGITAAPFARAPHALIVTDGARAIQRSKAYLQGLVELQDAASQATVDAIAVPEGARVLDFCAGGGGKALALAAYAGPTRQVTAHDIDPARMKDIPARAARAGVRIDCKSRQDLTKGGYDIVFVDAPCSGSGSWRRAPDGKWALTPERLEILCATQQEVLRQASEFVTPGGLLAYATCSILDVENYCQVRSFGQKANDFHLGNHKTFSPIEGGDGFFISQFRCGLD
ncbi:16S rRNA (cytosine967-C5)-methyltransferase [Rubricella aquisinus]|uniref:16S rRNA (Cytosine967-C5)-methyltransferase n=1 Tax=Rubricella aquisinus TaxID=2028108 RepID=A0A840WMM0_9RHOB|nr:RsmB/NOP family class I SAM-dependent RNA methyltransferase [Rubricella aquisinus]MBB5514902.1 16S rRNA (cytosine967-C5)-methyltransferase [Rubricella aquisinus]